MSALREWESPGAQVTSSEVKESIPKWPKIQEIDQPVTETIPQFKRQAVRTTATTEDWFKRPYAVKPDLAEAAKALNAVD